MDFKYRWKNGTPPTRDQAASSDSLLDESQFTNEKDRQIAEEMARKQLDVPTRIPDEDRPTLPHADSHSVEGEEIL
ncbi:bromodomain-containing protein [Leptolyngbya ohadii]|uniref:bromodomain-containing protein n=1 Tax=Leptolyngbya ohadii TaxID=1962290 RepID=UPI000B59CF51|nr:bromodomain-containing protein [Leptolyngbya ohadii]